MRKPTEMASGVNGGENVAGFIGSNGREQGGKDDVKVSSLG